MTTTLLIVGLVRGAAWARDISKTDDLSIAGLVEIDAEKLARVGDELGVPPERRYVDFDRALEAEADIVVVATPPALHKEMSLAALRAGHHVICEKPVTRDLAEARALREAVRASDRRFMVGEQYRFADGCENLRRAVAEGLIGRPVYLAHEFGRAGGPGAHPSPSRSLRSLDLGGGPGDHPSPRPSRPAQRPAGQDTSPHGHIPGMSVHHFDMWWYITGRRPVEIRADPIVPPGDGSGRPLGYSMRATLEDGLHVQYFDRRALARPQTTWYGDLWVVGDEGALFWNGVGSAVTLSRSLPTHDYREQHLASGPVSFVSRDASGGATMLMVRTLVEAIRQGRPHPCDMEDNWVSFATAMAAVESAQTGRAVKVERE